MEAAHRTALAKGEVGIRERTPPPILADFCKRVEDFASANYKHAPKTLLWYKFGLKTIRNSEIASRKLDEITPEHIAGFIASLQSSKWEVASINSALRAVRAACSDWHFGGESSLRCLKLCSCGERTIVTES
jgi:hypothetical protein